MLSPSPFRLVFHQGSNSGTPCKDLLVLRAHGFAGEQINSVKVIKTGELSIAVTLKGITATAGAKAAIEAAGGKLVELA